MVEHAAVNRRVVGSSPTRGAISARPVLLRMGRAILEDGTPACHRELSEAGRRSLLLRSRIHEIGEADDGQMSIAMAGYEGEKGPANPHHGDDREEFEDTNDVRGQKQQATLTTMSTSTGKYHRALLVFCFLAGLNFPAAPCLAQSGTHRDQDTVRLCFVSDTQEPMFFERLFVKYNRNAQARALLFGKISELHPQAVVHLGDLVSRGSDNDSWKEIDEFVGLLRDAHIEFFPIPGNHEYLLSSKKGISNFMSRYRDVPLTGYSKRYRNLAIVVFNSNVDELTDDESRGQLRWFRQTLRDYEADPSIDFVVVGCHRPPFTNSKIVSGSEDMRRDYVPAFTRFRKCKLFLSGHSHAFEHFKIAGKDFLVIGGGGGLQHPLHLGEDAEYKDIFSDSLEKRMFHFLTMKAYGDTLAVELKMLKPDFAGFESIPLFKFAGDQSQGVKTRKRLDR